MISPTERAELRLKAQNFRIMPNNVLKLLDSLDELERERDLLRADWEAMRECLDRYDSRDSIRDYRLARDCLAGLRVGYTKETKS